MSQLKLANFKKLIDQLESIITCPDLRSKTEAATAVLKIKNNSLDWYRYLDLKYLNQELIDQLKNVEINFNEYMSTKEAIANAQVYYFLFQNNCSTPEFNPREAAKYLTEAYFNGHSLAAWSINETFHQANVMLPINLPLRPLEGNHFLHNIDIAIHKIKLDSHFYNFNLNLESYKAEAMFFEENAENIIRHSTSDRLAQIISSLQTLSRTETGTYQSLFEELSKRIKQTYLNDHIESFHYVHEHKEYCTLLTAVSGHFQSLSQKV